MNTLKLAFRKLFRKGEYTTSRIVSLAVGLAFGIILLGEVLYYYSFDNFYTDIDNIYTVQENFKQDKKNKEMKTHGRVSGAIGPGLVAEVPGVEAATRLNHFANTDFLTDDKKIYKAKFSLADEYWEKVLPRPMISGNAHDVLTKPMHCMISDELAEKMGGDVIGKTIELKSDPNKPLTISGVFKSLPENTLYDYDVLVSMVSTKEFTWDGTNNWLGNDRYYTCVKLKKGVTPESLAPAIRLMQEKHQDIEEMEAKNPGFKLIYTFTKNKEIYPAQYKNMILILSIIAFSVLFVALMNYILLTVTILVSRAKNSAIHKCYGARASNLHAMIFSEAVMVFIMSLLFAGLIIYFAKPFVEEQVGHKISSMFSLGVTLPLGGLLLLLLALIGYFPGYFFARIPVAAAFRNYRQKSNKWKLGLLSLQFIGASFILAILTVVMLQYNKMQNADHGYQAESVYYIPTTGMDANKLSTVINELEKIPEVELVSLGENTPLYRQSGNNVFSDDGEKELFNIADFYYIDENYMQILDIPISDGRNFTENNQFGDVLISQSCEDKLIAYNKWSDGVIGKSITISEHNRYGKSTISGVFPDFIVGSISNRDNRPAVFFFLSQSRYIDLIKKNPQYSTNIFVKATHGHSDYIMTKLADVANIAIPTNDSKVFSLAEKKCNIYKAEKGFRNTMLVGNTIILLITIIGLLGYSLSEVNRRRKELAIRKINGATVSNVLRLFLWDMQRMAIPAVLLGIIGSWFVANKWMQNFSEKITLTWFIFIMCSIAILFFIGLISVASYWKSAKSNPIEALRYE